MKTKRIVALLLTACLVFAFAGCAKKEEAPAANPAATTAATTAADSDYAYIMGNGKMVIGVTKYKPMDYLEDGKWTGFDAEFAEAVCEKMGIEAEFIEIDWDNKFIELESKAIDCIWNGMTISEEVLNNTNCSKAYVDNKQVVVMAADKLDQYQDAESMKDLTFAVESGSAGQTAAKDNKYKFNAVAAQSDALLEVSSGSSDACIIDITMANSMTGEGTDYADLGIGLSLTSEEYGIGFRKGSDMADKMNEYIDTFMNDGTLDQLAEKYELNLAK